MKLHIAPYWSLVERVWLTGTNIELILLAMGVSSIVIELMEHVWLTDTLISDDK